ncbi:hypothetical protein HGA88_06760 [Candidatus Roizmanbacteria bacterium]|nr:hypothetical protein [Candidatus Roizmanbacteria bacterium]
MSPQKLLKIDNLKIILSLILAFVLVKTMGYFSVFLPNTPTINPVFVAQLSRLPQETASFPHYFIAFVSDKITDPWGTEQSKLDQTLKNSIAVPPASAVFKPLASGVMAAEDKKTGITYVQLKKGTRVQITTTVGKDGKEVKTLKILSVPHLFP